MEVLRASVMLVAGDEDGGSIEVAVEEPAEDSASPRFSAMIFPPVLPTFSTCGPLKKLSETYVEGSAHALLAPTETGALLVAHLRHDRRRDPKASRTASEAGRRDEGWRWHQLLVLIFLLSNNKTRR